MATGQLIHDELITDFAALQYVGGATIFNNVKKFYAADSMKSSDCLILPASNTEEIAGNTSTHKVYSFDALAIEVINDTDSDAEGALKYSRLLNIQDSILDYIQLEPSNLNAWGQLQSPVLNVYKIRLSQVAFDEQLTQGGFAAVMRVRFSIFINITPQNI